MMSEKMYRGIKWSAKETRNGKKATVIIGGKTFNAARSPEGPEGSIKLWMCNEAYSMFPTLESMARHFIENWSVYEQRGV